MPKQPLIATWSSSRFAVEQAITLPHQPLEFERRRKADSVQSRIADGVDEIDQLLGDYACGFPLRLDRRNVAGLQSLGRLDGVPLAGREAIGP